MNAIAPIQAGNVEAYRASTDAANMCKEIVVATATRIQGRKYVTVEGWQAIAIAHGCTASARDVEAVEGGVRAIGEIRRMSDGAVISVAEGFVGEDEATWFGGDNGSGKKLPKRPDYAIRAMAQTRAISRACRSAFAHVVVMMKAGLATTPAEEVPEGGFDREPHNDREQRTIEAKPKAISDAQFAELQTLIETSRVQVRDVCEKAKIGALKDLPASRFEGCKQWVKEQTADRGGKSVQASDIIDDDIPY